MPHGPKLSYLPDSEGSTALYRRLNFAKHEIRVLTVWPNEDFWAPLEGTLRITSPLDEIYDHDALSYYWGSANDLEYVIVHGSDEGKPMPSCEVPVTRNLVSALRELRRRAVTAGEPLKIWTDALCIDPTRKYENGARSRLGSVRASEVGLRAHGSTILASRMGTARSMRFQRACSLLL